MMQLYHSQEDSKLGIHVHAVTIGEDEVVFAFLLAGEYDGDLLGSHWEYRQLDTIELIKTTPATRLGQTWNEGREAQSTNEVKVLLVFWCWSLIN